MLAVITNKEIKTKIRKTQSVLQIVTLVMTKIAIKITTIANNAMLKDIKKIFDSNINSESIAKKFEVKVILDNVTIAESDVFRMRVIVYGPHTNGYHLHHGVERQA
jgi:hypothetical protein